MIDENLKRQILDAADKAAPSEMCGFIYCADGSYRFEQTRNAANNPAEHFDIPPEEYERVEGLGEIVAVVHSHPDGTPFLSTADRECQLQTALPWVLAAGSEVLVIPCVAPLLGRTFEYGVSDCAALGADAYSLVGISLPKPPRIGLQGDMDNRSIVKGLQSCGAYPVTGGIQAGDILLFDLGGTANHAGIYLGGSTFLHHADRQPSKLEYFGDAWQKSLNSVWRHPDFTPDKVRAFFNDFEVFDG